MRRYAAVGDHGDAPTSTTEFFGLRRGLSNVAVSRTVADREHQVA